MNKKGTKGQLPRGLRNNNPGNLRRSGDKWKGLCAEQTDPDFFQFETMRYGYRALMRTLQTYSWKHGCRTIADYIHRWAPSSENDTLAYIKAVCTALGVPSDHVPDLGDKETMCLLAAAISRVENGVDADMKEVEGGWRELIGR